MAASSAASSPARPLARYEVCLNGLPAGSGCHRGSSGIGAAIAQRLAGEGAAVVACARHEPTESLGERIIFVTADVTVPAEIEGVMDAARSRYGRIDVVVANAGTGGGGQWPGETLEEWQSILDLNLNGSMLTCRAAWPHLLASTGSVVLVSSLSAVMASANTSWSRWAASSLRVIPGIEGGTRRTDEAPGWSRR